MKSTSHTIIGSCALPILLAFATPLFAQDTPQPPPALPGAPGGGLPSSRGGAPGGGLPGAPGAPAPKSGSATKSATPDQILARDTEIEVIKTHLKQVNAEIQELEQAPAANAPEQEKRAAKVTALKAFGKRLEHSLSKLENSTGKNPEAHGNGKAGLSQGHRPLQAVGAPDASEDTFEGTLLAWHAQPSDSGKEWLGLIYERAVEVAEVRIHTINTTGTLARITACVRGGSGGDKVIWEDREPAEKTPAVRVITVNPGTTANGIRLEFDTTRAKKWQQIDAVELVGRDGSRQWAQTSEASSYYPISERPSVDGKDKAPGDASN